MIYFNNDYSEGCHSAILEKLTATNMEQTPGYGMDDHCAAAAASWSAPRSISWRAAASHAGSTAPTVTSAAPLKRPSRPSRTTAICSRTGRSETTHGPGCCWADLRRS